MADELISCQKHNLSIPEKGVMAGDFKTGESDGKSPELMGVAQSLPPSPSFSDTGDVPMPLTTVFNIDEGSATLRGVGSEDA